MILHVANLGHPVLRQQAQPVAPAEIDQSAFQSFLDDLLESMRYHDGVGLAAPQVFRSQRVIAVWVPPEMDESGQGLEAQVVLNPEVEPVGEEVALGFEGCLSLKDLRGLVPRYDRIRLRGLDRRGESFERELSGYPARVFQHEVDHLDGIVFTDRMLDSASLCFANELERYGPPESVADDEDE